MAATGYTPISLYYSTTAAAAPVAGNLVNGELAINITDGKLYYKDNGGNVKVIAGAGGAGIAGGSNTQIQYNSSGNLAGSANFVFDGTNVGIGTSSPALPLTVQSGAATQIRCRSTTTRYRTSWGIDTAGNTTIDSYDDTGTAYTPITINGNQLKFAISGTTQMLLDSSGNLGIGTTSPSEKLTVTSSSSTNAVLLLNGGSGSATGAGIKMQKQGTSFAFIGAASWIEGGTSNDLAFSANSGATIGMRLDSSGNLGLGVTPSTSTVKTFEIGAVGNGLVNGGTADTYFVAGGYYNAGWKYALTGTAVASYEVGAGNGSHVWKIAGSGTAGNALTWTSAMTLDASGNLLVGTTTATQKMTVAGNIGSTGQFVPYNGSTALGYIGNDNSISGGSGSNIGLRSESAMLFATGGSTERMRIDTSGNVGIGTSSPSYKLDVAGLVSSQDAYLITANSSGTPSAGAFMFRPASNTLAFGTASTERMRIDSSGNLLFNGTTVKNNAPGVSVKTSQQGFIVYNGVDASYNELGVWDGSADGLKAVIKAESGLAKFGSRTNSAVVLQTNDNEKARLSAAGGFSVGTTTDPGAGYISDQYGNVRSIPQNAQTAAYVLVASDKGKHISITTGGVTCNASIFSAGDAVTIYNNSGSNQTITAGTNVTFRLAGTATTGNRTLAQYGVATLLCVTGGATPTFVVSGAGVS